MIELKDILIQYDQRSVLDIPSLRFEKGKRYGLIGENGSGKTTLLRLLAGTLTPDRGSVVKLTPNGMGYIPQHPYAFSFSVLRNVEMALDKSEDRREQALAALDKVGMGQFVNARGDRLSGGEAQRMACARIIAKPRQLILLDEPTSSTDIKGMDLVEQTILDYAAQCGCTLIFSTHSPAQALRLAGEVIFLHQGKIVEQGPAEKLLNQPTSEQARLFLQHWRL